MKTNNQTTRGGQSSALGNIFQAQVSMLLVLSKINFSFFTQHQNEDVEFYDEQGNVTLFQMKSKLLDSKEIKASDVASWIKSYTAKKSWLEFYVNNESTIGKWIFVFNKEIINDGNGATAKTSIFKSLKNLEDIKDTSGNITITKTLRNDFVKILKKKISFKINDINSNNTYKKLASTEFAKVNKVPTKSLPILDSYTTKIINQNLEFIKEVVPFDYESFSEFYEGIDDDKEFFTKDEVWESILQMTNDIEPESQEAIQKLSMAYGYIEMRTILKNINDKNFRSKAIDAGLSDYEIEILRRENA